MTDPPPVPHRLHDMTTVLAVGSSVWLVGAAVLMAAHLAVGRPLDVWFTTCLVGAGLGAIGYGIFSWQRAAARRGSRGAQQGLGP